MSTTDTASTPPSQTLACPECRTAVPFGVAACPSCGIRLTGPLAARLWQVDQQVARLSAEAAALRRRLLLPPDAAELAEVAHAHQAQQMQAQQAQLGDVLPGLHSYQSAPPPAQQSSVSGQQILLGLGALLLLAGLSFFVAVVWFLVGIVGQAVIMLVLTGLAATGAVAATRKRLPAAAETAAVIASGLVIIDLWAAHGLGLAGLDSVRADLYWSIAGLMGAAVVLGFDRVVPHRDAQGELPRISTYAPVSFLLALSALWAGFAAADPTGVWASAGLLVVAATSLGLVWVMDRLVEGTEPASGWFLWPASISAGFALLFHLALALDIGYGDNPASERYAAMALLLVLPALVLAARRHPWVAARPRLSSRLGFVVLLGAAAAVGVPLMEVSRGGLVAIAVVLGVVLTVLALRGADGESDASEQNSGTMGWGDLVTWVGRLAILVLFWFTYLLAEQGASSGLDYVAQVHDAGTAAWWLPGLPALALLVPTVVSAVRRDSALLTLAAHVIGFLALVVAMRDAESMVWVVVGLAVAVLLTALAAVSRMAQLEGRNEANEMISLVGATIATAAALGGSMDHTALTQACVLVGMGCALLAYAALPGRLGFAYAGALGVTIGIGLVLAEQDVSAIEAYTGPAAVLLACIGFVQWSRDRGAPTMLTMAPALATALLPSLAAAFVEGPLLRLVAVTVCSMVVLGMGLWRRWQGPVVVGTIALAWLAVNQGGPVVEYIPGWVLLVSAGTALLVAGVLWEHAIAAGRRTAAWFAALQ